MTLCRHELRMNRTSLIIWCGVVCAMSVLTMLLYPTFKDQMGQLSSVMAMLGPFSAALGLDQLDMTTAIGFYGIEAGTMLAVGGAMFAAFTGIGMLAKEEGGHTAEFLLTQPISRMRVVLEKLAALTVLLVLFNAVCALVGWLCFVAIGETLPTGRFLLYHALQLMLHMEIACICFGLSAFARRTQIGLGLGIALLLYFLSLIINMVDAVDFLRYVSPFTYADATVVFTKGGVDGVLVAIGGAVTLAGIGAALWRYGRKDIAA